MPTHPYILLAGTHQHATAAKVEIPTDFSSDDWSRMAEHFTRTAHPRCGKDWLDHYLGSYMLREEWRTGNVYWDEELASRDGMSFLILPMPEATPEETRALRARLRRDRDVVRIQTAQIHHWITFPPTTHA